MAPIYITGHRNPDSDSIAAAIGYAELKRRLDPDSDYVPVRLGDCNAQTNWLLERAGAQAPAFLPHVMPRAQDVMKTEFPMARLDEPIRKAGLAMAKADLELVPIVDDDGRFAGVLTERALARRYVRESRATSTLEEAPTFLSAIVEVLQAELLTGEDRQLSGRVWVHSMESSSPSGISEGDVVVVGDREGAQSLALKLGAGLLIASNSARPSQAVLALAQEKGAAVAVSPLDSYITGRMITLAAPCRALMDPEPLTITPDFLIDDISEQIKELHYGAAVALDGAQRPVGLVTRSDIVSPPRRRVILVDHAELGQSVNGIAEAEIMEILDHHHIGSVETRVPVTATFDPVGSTATLVVERFRQNGLEPSRTSAMMLLGAVLSDTVILNSPTTTERDHEVVTYLERALAVDAQELGREMFEATADVSEVSAEEIISRDAKRYTVGGERTIAIAQVEVVGKGLLERREELLEAMRDERERKELALYALMVTDVLEHGTEMLVAGDVAAVARAFDVEASDSTLELPGVMSRKKEVAPRLMTAL
ncbi:MAG TPA: putative manganese-dependent inorganic diphosphatase [Solirubrobacteraceae bacterium]|nr:putative manganese-dependent inorganic diphosphatase [Solirubrobacteraceae bacterium]